jgi:DNA helicase-2/ATP-dependent DNA helicase PcrA
LGNPNKFLVDLVQHFSRLRDEDISPADYLHGQKNPSREQEKAVETGSGLPNL